MINGKIHYKWSFSIATLNYQKPLSVTISRLEWFPERRQGFSWFPIHARPKYGDGQVAMGRKTPWTKVSSGWEKGRGHCEAPWPEWMWLGLHRSKMGRPWTRPRTLQRIHDRSDMFSSCFFSSITVEATVYRACFCLMLACRILGRSIHETLILTSAQARISKTSVWLPQFLGIEPWSASSRSFAATKTDVLLCRKATHHWGI